jgi:hypothetical protein
MLKRSILPVVFILFFAGIVFHSCTKNDPPVIANCFDGIKNQDEAEIDCGGVCFPCPKIMKAKINGNSWVADTSKIKASYSDGATTFQLTGSTENIYPQISLVYLGSFSTGSHTLDHSTSFSNGLSGFVVFNSGTVNISTLENRGSDRLLNGTFNLTCTDTSSATVYNITEGVFENVPY